MYLEKHDDLQLLNNKLLGNIEVFNDACLQIHLILDKLEFDQLVSTDEILSDSLTEPTSTFKLSIMLSRISKQLLTVQENDHSDKLGNFYRERKEEIQLCLKIIEKLED